MTRSLVWTQYLAFVTLGLIMSLTGPLLPALRAEIPMSYLESGLIVSAQFVGMILVPLGGHLGPSRPRKSEGAAAFAAHRAGRSLLSARG